MSHSGEKLGKLEELEALSPMLAELREHQEKLKGEYPDGKLSADDQGALHYGTSTIGDKVIIAFAEPVQWFGMTGDEAAALATVLLKRAKEAGLARPVTITL